MLIFQAETSVRQAKLVYVTVSPVSVTPQLSFSENNEGTATYPKDREDVIGETSADDIAPPGEDSSDVVLE